MLTTLLTTTLCSDSVAKRYPIIPKPLQLVAQEGFCTLGDATQIVLSPSTYETQELASFIVDFLSKSLDNIQVVEKNCPDSSKSRLFITIDEKCEIDPEGYFLSVTPDTIEIQAKTTQGAFWAFQTLRALMPAEVERNGLLEIPCVTITDAPRFGYRGLHLDVSRHMFAISFIKQYIDFLAKYKLNTFHWHLTDDQGWRVEIKKYPKLQEVAAYRTETLIGHANSAPHIFDGTSYGGYYSQQEIQEVVQYAKKRHVTIIPEIELPGHCLAVLCAYPELGCTEGPYTTATTWGIFEDVYCAGKEEVFSFLEDVFTEIIELFPGTYIHIGGDEVVKKCWKKCHKCQARMKAEGLKDEDELQSYFVRRIEKFLNSKGRQIIGWDEILQGGISPNATVMSWKAVEGAITAARLNHQAIMTPCQYLYFDHYQTKSIHEPLAIGGYTSLNKVYEYEPIPSQLSDEQAPYILGVQANVWTEYMPSYEHVVYMICPRMLALAEIAWTQKEQKNYTDFLERLPSSLDQNRANRRIRPPLT